MSSGGDEYNEDGHWDDPKISDRRGRLRLALKEAIGGALKYRKYQLSAVTLPNGDDPKISDRPSGLSRRGVGSSWDDPKISDRFSCF